jgi:hypothetical protein
VIFGGEQKGEKNSKNTKKDEEERKENRGQDSRTRGKKGFTKEEGKDLEHYKG